MATPETMTTTTMICNSFNHHTMNDRSLDLVTHQTCAGLIFHENHTSIAGSDTQTPGLTEKENHKSVLRRSWYRICIFRHTSKVPCTESGLLGQLPPHSLKPKAKQDVPGLSQRKEQPTMLQSDHLEKVSRQLL